jgi:tetratricopeptide (TPR) repeat protein
MSAEEKKAQITAEPKSKGGTAVKERHKPAETSVLGQRLLEYWERIKQGQSRLTWYVLGGVAVIIILVFVWRYYAGLSKGKDSARFVLLWTSAERVDSYQDEDPRRTLSTEEKQVRVLDDYIKDNEGKAQARYARFELARLLLSRGVRDLRSRQGFMPGQPSQAAADVKRAAEIYEGLIADSSDVPLLQAEALLNAGKAHEALGEVDRAKELYERLTNEKELKDGYAAREAADLLKRLNDPATRSEIQKLAAEPNR